MAVRPVPEGYHTVTPYLVVNDAARLVDFMKQAFDAREAYVARAPDGTVMHADMTIGDSHIMLGQAGGPTPALSAMLYLYVSDCDALYHQAVRAGGKSLREPTTEFYGDRSGAVQDPWGNHWYIATHVEDVAPEELDRRMKAARQNAATA